MSSRTAISNCLAVGVIGFTLLFTTACAERTQAGSPGPPPAIPVKVQVAQPQSVGEFTEYLATLKSRSASVLQPQVEGQITRIYVHSGDRVEAGTTLLTIDPLKQEAALTNSEATRRARLANRELARKELERRKQLFEAGVISRQDLDQAESAYDAANADVEALEAGVREQRVQLHYYNVKAPAAGIIGDIPVRVGDRVTNQTVLTTLDRGGELEAYISIPAEKGRAVHEGTPVDIVGEDAKALAHAKVTFISPRVDPATQLVLVKATVPNEDRRFRNEQVVHARVIWEQVQRSTIPITAVSRVSGKTFAFVAEDSNGKTVARQRAVQLGEIIGNEYVVLDGIKPGDRIITTGVQTLADGMAVSAQS